MAPPPRMDIKIHMGMIWYGKTTGEISSTIIIATVISSTRNRGAPGNDVMAPVITICLRSKTEPAMKLDASKGVWDSVLKTPAVVQTIRLSSGTSELWA
jgi:hypothetical protein